jgi:DMATS type aromatic prenyltransferase
VVGTFRSLVSPWGDTPVNHRSTWVSEISDDNTPIELSVAIADGQPEVRILFEAQAEEPTLRAHRAAGIALNLRLERDFGADLRRFRAVQDLFLPEDLQGPFAVWSSAVFSPGKAPSFKAYFNPQAQGAARAPALVEEALSRLGFRRAWGALSRAALRRGPHLDEVKYFALDLASTDSARVKVYVHHHAATPDDLELACAMADSYVPGEAREFARAMRRGDDRLTRRAPFTCDSFTEAGDARPAATTLYVPICAYARDDDEARLRVRDYLVAEGGDPALYEAILRGFAHRPLDAGVGMQSWVAHRRYQGRSRLTVYLGTETRRICEPGTVPAATPDRTTFASAEDVIRRVSAQDLGQHPFVQRMKRHPGDPGPLWKMIATLNLGHEPGQRLALDLAPVAEDPLEAVGALVAGEVLAQQLREAIAEQLRAQRDSVALALDPHRIDWLALHEAIDGDRLEEGLVVARKTPPHAVAVARFQRGAEGVHQAIWRALDELYELCFEGDSQAMRPREHVLPSAPRTEVQQCNE